VEVVIQANGLDSAHMVMDFGLFKNTIGPFIKSFDKTHSLWSKDDPDYIEYVKKENSRYLTMTHNPSAESISLYMFCVIDKILNNTAFNNKESNPTLHSVRVHETETGWAETSRNDMFFFKMSLDDISFSDAIINEWKDPDMWNKLVTKTPFVNPVAKQQVIVTEEDHYGLV
jgi:6-pyruvoyltetrahydropterin/6-carboxytetrahydropterin synthase